MRTEIREFVQLVAESIPLRGPVYEFGALQVTGNAELEDLRPLFPGIPYVGCDMRTGPGVDKVLDLHCIALDDKTAAVVITMDTLEHVEYPRIAISEMHRVLDDEGILIMSSVMKFPIHAYPNDFWRFTPEGFRSLLKPFDNSFVGSFGESLAFPHTILGIGFKGQVPDLSRFEALYKPWEHFYSCMCRNLLEEQADMK